MPTIETKDIAECVSLFYEDALRGSLHASQAKLASLVDCTSALTFTPFVLRGSRVVFDPYRIPKESFNDYAEYYHLKDVWMPLVMRPDLSSGTIIAAERYVPPKTVLASEFYNDFLRHYEISNVCCLIVSSGLDSRLPRIHTSLYRPDYRRPFTQKEQRLLAMLSEKLRRALELAAWFVDAKEHSMPSLELLDVMPFGVLILNSKKKVIFVNAVARKVMRAEEWLRVRDGDVCVDDARENRALDDALDAALAETAEVERRAGTRFVVSRQSHRNKAVLEVHQLPISIAPNMPPDDKYIVVFIRNVQAALGDAVHVLGETYGLTHAEARLAFNLAKGLTLNEYASDRGVSINTVRTQAKQVLAKTNTRRQPELIALINRLTLSN